VNSRELLAGSPPIRTWPLPACAARIATNPLTHVALQASTLTLVILLCECMLGCRTFQTSAVAATNAADSPVLHQGRRGWPPTNTAKRPTSFSTAILVCLFGHAVRTHRCVHAPSQRTQQLTWGPNVTTCSCSLVLQQGVQAGHLQTQQQCPSSADAGALYCYCPLLLLLLQGLQ
jgi:hypothetical protein